jgi:hypothetical protein
MRTLREIRQVSSKTLDGKAAMTFTFSSSLRMSNRDVSELEARMERLKALVLLTQRDLALYCHARLLHLMVFDDFHVRAAARDACTEEIRSEGS